MVSIDFIQIISGFQFTQIMFINYLMCRLLCCVDESRIVEAQLTIYCLVLCSDLGLTLNWHSAIM